jgi:hypothetical protein
LRPDQDGRTRLIDDVRTDDDIGGVELAMTQKLPLHRGTNIGQMRQEFPDRSELRFHIAE